MLTKKQKNVLDFIKSYQEKHDYSPSLDDIRQKFKLASVSTAHFHVKKLEDLGYLRKDDNKPRAIDVYESEQMVSIPLMGTISAGQPINAIQEKEVVTIPKNKLPHAGNFFALKVKGESMIEENINDGDLVLIKEQITAENGDRIVALIDKNEATLKKFFKEKNQIRLQPANKTFAPIIVKPEQDFDIQGIVIDVIKSGFGSVSLETKKQTEIQTIKKYDKLPLNQIICGDALVELKKMPSESCDVIVVDPPYNIGKDFGNNIDKKELTDYVSWCREWINECIRIMKPTATMFIYGFSEILAYLSVEIPLEKRWLIWHYTNKNVASLNFWQRSHESIICCWKEKPVFNRDEIREPYTEGFLNGAAGKVRKGTVGRFSRDGKETVYNAHENGALPRDVIKIPALAGGAGMSERWFLCKTCNDVFSPRELPNHKDHEVIKHPTQKPLELSKKLIMSCLPKGESITLVPFVGSGSECVAAKELDSSFIGFELNPDYIRIAEKILKTKKHQDKLII